MQMSGTKMPSPRRIRIKSDSNATVSIVVGEFTTVYISRTLQMEENIAFLLQGLSYILTVKTELFDNKIKIGFFSLSNAEKEMDKILEEIELIGKEDARQDESEG